MRSVIVIAAVMFIGAAAAQEQKSVTFTLPQWEAMDRDLHKVSMPEEAHQAIRQIMNQYSDALVKQAAAADAAKARVAAEVEALKARRETNQSEPPKPAPESPPAVYPKP